MCERHYRRWKKHGHTDSVRIDNMSHYTVQSDGCWHWDGATYQNGYGKLSVLVHGTRLAHRAFYVEHNGELSSGVDVDHACHNADPTCQRGPGCPHRRCVNPAHLEAVSHRDNLRNGIAAQEVCESGLHDLTLPGAIIKGTIRGCVECWRIRYRKASKRYRAKRA